MEIHSITVKDAYRLLRSRIRAGEQNDVIFMGIPEEGDVVVHMGPAVPMEEFGDFIRREPEWRSYMHRRTREE